MSVTTYFDSNNQRRMVPGDMGFTANSGSELGFGPNVSSQPYTANNQILTGNQGANPYGDMFSAAIGSNRYGDPIYMDPAGPMSAEQGATLMESPYAWLTGAIAPLGMRTDPDLGFRRRRLDEYLGGNALGLLYRQATGSASGGTDALSWLNNLVQGYSGGAGDGNFLGPQGARAMIDRFQAGQFDPAVQELISGIDEQSARNYLDLLMATAFQGMDPIQLQAFERASQRKMRDWSNYIAQTLNEVPFYEYFNRSGVLEHFGL